MFVVRNVFRTHPGKAKELVAKFKAAAPLLADEGVRSTRILSDEVADFWTVVVENEVESLEVFFTANRARQGPSKAREALAGYMDLVQSGRREIFKVE
jgi:hypothetical protein